MTLKLRFFVDKDTQIPYQVWPRDGEPPIKFEATDRNVTLPIELTCNRENSGGRFSDVTYVEASLDGGGILKGRYQLKLAYKPDFAPVTDGDGDFVSYKNNEPFSRMQLLRGADGDSWLRLLIRASAASESKWEELLKFRIAVKASYEKSSLMRAMVDELLEENPQEVLSELNGLSQTNVGRRWNRGGCSAEWSIAWEKYQELRKLYEDISPRLMILVRNCATRLSRRYERVRLENLRRPSHKTACDIAKRGARDGMPVKVLGWVVYETMNVDIHRAIKDFLLRLKCEVSELLKVVSKSLEQDRMTRDALLVQDAEWVKKERKALNQWEAEEKQEEIVFKRKIVTALEKMKEGCAIFLAKHYPWGNCRRLPITHVPIMRVPASEHYRYLYVTMLRFVQKRFLLSSVSGHFYVPTYARNDVDEPSTWQKNYSYIYEAWVYKRLVQAFAEEGFREISESYRKQARRMLQNLQLGPATNEPVCAEMDSGEMRLEVFHGLKGYRGERDAPQIGFTAKGKQRVTPDFAIVFTTAEGRDKQLCYWIVLDAKSGMNLGGDDRAKRDMYSHHFLRNGRRPDQSWLVYSGDYYGSAGVETDEDFLRVNHHTAVSCDAFREFARRQIATAKELFGVSQQ